MGYLFALLGGYLLGSSNMAYYLSRWKKADFRKEGSGNLGASNATVLLGWWAGIFTAIHDIGKAVLAVLLTRWLFPQEELLPVAAGVACVLGHIFPFYLGFRGGKGLASFFGMTLALNWKIALAVAVMIFLVTVITDYIACGTLASTVVVPAALGILTHNWTAVLIICIASAVMIFRHLDNIRRILRGTELGLRSTMRGENRL